MSLTRQQGSDLIFNLKFDQDEERSPKISPRKEASQINIVELTKSTPNSLGSQELYNFHSVIGKDINAIQPLGSEKRQIIYEPGVRRKSKGKLPLLSKMSSQIKREIKVTGFNETSSPKQLIDQSVLIQKIDKPLSKSDNIKDATEEANQMKDLSRIKRTKRKLLVEYQSMEDIETSPIKKKSDEIEKPSQRRLSVFDQPQTDQKTPIKQIKPEKMQEKQPIEPEICIEQKTSKQEKKVTKEKVQDYLQLKVVLMKQLSNRKEFLSTPVFQGRKLQLTIKRDKGGLGLFPQYDVFMSNEYRHLMSAKKQSGNATSNYHITIDKNQYDPESQSYLGKVRSNFTGSSYQIYNNGCNHEKKDVTRRAPRKILASVHYQSHGLGIKKPRKMQVYLPNNPYIQTAPEKDLKQQWQNQPQKYISLINQLPQWNQSKNIYILDFKGRVHKPSIKNFILVRKANQQILVMLFGRVDEDIFNLDVLSPLTPLQAFGIVLSSFDTKIQ